MDKVGGYIPTNEELVLAYTAATFSTAFIQALGKRAGDGLVDLSKRVGDLVRAGVRKKGTPTEYHLEAEDGTTVAVIIVTTGIAEYHIEVKDGTSPVVIVTADLPDEARLALLDLDVTSDELRGKPLRWDSATGAWCPSEALSEESGIASDPS
jgi:hypothetical protein